MQGQACLRNAVSVSGFVGQHRIAMCNKRIAGPHATPRQSPHPKPRRGTRGMSRSSSCLTSVMDVE